MAAKLKIEEKKDETFKKSSPPEPPDTFLEENHPMTISSKFCSY
jgi:hypothetical protein